MPWVGGCCTCCACCPCCVAHVSPSSPSLHPHCQPVCTGGHAAGSQLQQHCQPSWLILVHIALAIAMYTTLGSTILKMHPYGGLRAAGCSTAVLTSSPCTCLFEGYVAGQGPAQPVCITRTAKGWEETGQPPRQWLAPFNQQADRKRRRAGLTSTGRYRAWWRGETRRETHCSSFGLSTPHFQ